MPTGCSKENKSKKRKVQADGVLTKNLRNLLVVECSSSLKYTKLFLGRMPKQAWPTCSSCGGKRSNY